MIKNNIFGQVLIGLLVVFLLVASIQMLGIGQKIATIEVDGDNQSTIPRVPKGINSNEAEDSTDYKKIVENIETRPVFSQERKPFVSLVETDETQEDNPEPIAELKAKLTGIVLTPDQSYAMILDNLTNEREVYRVGMPLDGEQGGWTLTEIQARKVVFTSEDDKTEELELAVHSGSTAKSKPKTTKSVKNTSSETDKEPLNREDKKRNADDIRKKIAERRAQMRAEAAKKK